MLIGVVPSTALTLRWDWGVWWPGRREDGGPQQAPVGYIIDKSISATKLSSKCLFFPLRAKQRGELQHVSARPKECPLPRRGGLARPFPPSGCVPQGVVSVVLLPQQNHPPAIICGLGPKGLLPPHGATGAWAQLGAGRTSTSHPRLVPGEQFSACLMTLRALCPPQRTPCHPGQALPASGDLHAGWRWGGGPAQPLLPRGVMSDSLPVAGTGASLLMLR